MQLPSSLRTLQASHRPLPGFPTLDQLATHTAARIAMPHSPVSIAPSGNPQIAVGATPPVAPGWPQQPPTQPYRPSAASTVIWGTISTVSTAASAYHGYRRNQSVGWGIGWGIAGMLFPIITPAIAVAQGFGERAKK